MIKDRRLPQKTSNHINSHLTAAEIYEQHRVAYKNHPGVRQAPEPKTRHRAPKNRSRMDIVSAMLEAACGGATRSGIKRKVRISFTQLTEYLDYLLENEMLEYDQKTQLYRATEKGLRFARMYKEIGVAISPRARTAS